MHRESDRAVLGRLRNYQYADQLADETPDRGRSEDVKIAT